MSDIYTTWYLFSKAFKIGIRFRIWLLYNKRKNKLNTTLSKQFQNTTLSKQFQNTTLSRKQFQNTTLSKRFQNITLSKQFQYTTLSKRFQYTTLSKQFQNTTLSKRFQNTTLSKQYQNTTLSKRFQYTTLSKQFQSTTLSKQFQNLIDENRRNTVNSIPLTHIYTTDAGTSIKKIVLWPERYNETWNVFESIVKVVKCYNVNHVNINFNILIKWIERLRHACFF